MTISKQSESAILQAVKDLRFMFKEETGEDYRSLTVGKEFNSMYIRWLEHIVRNHSTLLIRILYESGFGIPLSGRNIINTITIEYMHKIERISAYFRIFEASYESLKTEPDTKIFKLAECISIHHPITHIKDPDIILHTHYDIFGEYINRIARDFIAIKLPDKRVVEKPKSMFRIAELPELLYLKERIKTYT